MQKSEFEDMFLEMSTTPETIAEILGGNDRDHYAVIERICRIAEMNHDAECPNIDGNEDHGQDCKGTPYYLNAAFKSYMIANIDRFTERELVIITFLFGVEVGRIQGRIMEMQSERAQGLTGLKGLNDLMERLVNASRNREEDV